MTDVVCAEVLNVDLDVHDAILQLAIRDDGIGGADLHQGSGLGGLASSPAGSGYTQVPVNR